jgi:hypothetical protein
MKPDWDALMDEYKDSKHGLVADVHCTAGGKSLCEKHGVKGYPTIMWGQPFDLQEYPGSRQTDALKQFALEYIGPVCGPDTLEMCDDAEKKSLAKFLKWDIDELEVKIEEKYAEVERIQEKGDQAIKKLEAEVQEMQEEGEAATKKKEDDVAKEKEKLNYKHLQAVKQSKTPKVDPDHDPELDEDL